MEATRGASTSIVTSSFSLTTDENKEQQRRQENYDASNNIRQRDDGNDDDYNGADASASMREEQWQFDDELHIVQEATRVDFRRDTYNREGQQQYDQEVEEGNDKEEDVVEERSWSLPLGDWEFKMKNHPCDFEY